MPWLQYHDFSPTRPSCNKDYYDNVYPVCLLDVLLNRVFGKTEDYGFLSVKKVKTQFLVK